MARSKDEKSVHPIRNDAEHEHDCAQQEDNQLQVLARVHHALSDLIVIEQARALLTIFVLHRAAYHETATTQTARAVNMSTR